MKSFFVTILLLLPAIIFTLIDKKENIIDHKINSLKSEQGTEEKKYPNDIEYIKRTFPFYKADPDAHISAMKDGNIMRKTAASDNSTPSWEFAGPLNIGGRVSDLEYDPNNPNIVYAGAATGGVFKSTDGGITFFSVFDDLAVLPIGDIAVDPVNSASSSAQRSAVRVTRSLPHRSQKIIRIYLIHCNINCPRRISHE